MLLGIRLVVGPVPALLLCAVLYLLDREVLRRVVQEVEARRGAGFSVDP